MSDTPNASAGIKGLQPKTSLRRLLIATNIGTTLEYFDFVMFGVVSGLVLPKLFFSAMSPFVALLASFLTFGVGLLMRPLGALYFGHRGDRVGRRRVMVLSLTMMGAATLGIGLLPGYSTIGIAAPILLVLLRCFQGFSLGGELGAATVLTLEYSPPRRRAFMNAAVQIGGPIGQILSSLTLLIVRGLVSESAFVSWAWRIPFLLGFIAAVVGVVIRSGIDESPMFRRAEQLANLRRAPIATVIREHPGLLVLLALHQAGPLTIYYVCMVYFPSYLAASLGLASSVGFAALLIGNLVSLPMLLISGALGDRYGRKPIIYVGSLTTLVSLLLYFPLLNTRSLVPIALATGLALGTVNLAAGCRTPMIAECFPTAVRNSGFNAVFSIAIVIGGSPAPLLAAVLLHWTGTPWSIAVAMAAAIVVSVAVVPFIPETVRRDIEADLSTRRAALAN